MLVSGEKGEGGWPLIKILHFFGPHRTSPLFDLSDPKLAEAAAFVSPEQLTGAPIDFRSEIYALGATLWFLMSATPPPVAPPASPEALTLKRFARRPRAPLQLPGVPENVAQLLGSMLARDPEDRTLDPGGLEEKIQACLSEINSKRIVTPMSATSPKRSPRPEAFAKWSSAGMKILATAGAAALIAIGLRVMSGNRSAPGAVEVSLAPKEENSNSARVEARETDSPRSMNFSVVPPSYESERMQIRALEREARRAVAQGAFSPNEPEPPAEGPGDPTVEIMTKTRRNLLKKTIESSPSIVITPGGNPAASVPPAKRQ